MSPIYLPFSVRFLLFFFSVVLFLFSLKNSLYYFFKNGLVMVKSFSFACLENSLLQIRMITLQDRIFLIKGFFFQPFEFDMPLPLAFKVSAEKADSLMEFPFYVIIFSLAAFNILSLIFYILIIMCLGAALFGFILFGTLWDSWIWMSFSLPG